MTPFNLSLSKFNPFNDFQRHHQFFATPELNQRIESIRHLIQNSEQLLLIIAEVNSGKTTLLNHLIMEAENHWWSHQITAKENVSPENLISDILTAFNVSHQGKPLAILQENLRNHLAATRYKSQLPILFIDDAELLPVETLQIAAKLAVQGESQTRMRVVLFCQPTIHERLAKPEFAFLHETLMHILDIPPLTEEQTHEYLQFCLAKTPYTARHPFTPAVTTRIHQQSQGKIFKINQLAKEVLEEFIEQQPALASPTKKSLNLKWGLVASFIIIILVTGGFLASWWANEDDKAIDLDLPSQNVAEESDSKKASSELNSLQAHTQIDPGKLTSSYGDSTDSSYPKSVLSGKNPFENREEVDLGVQDENWLLQQNPDAYTIQVLGAYDPLSLKAFIEQYDLSPLASFTTTYRGKQWHVLVQGIYPNRQAVNQALKNLPSGLKNTTKPWPRQLADIQSLIKQSQ